jgi:hypothetical protein
LPLACATVVPAVCHRIVLAVHVWRQACLLRRIMRTEEAQRNGLTFVCNCVCGDVHPACIIICESQMYVRRVIPVQGAFKNHLVLAASNDFTQPGQPRAVGLFRDPRRRLVSGWNDNKHSWVDAPITAQPPPPPYACWVFSPSTRLGVLHAAVCSIEL